MMKYANIYFREMTDEEKRTGKRNVTIFGWFSRKSDAIKAAKERGFSLPQISDCVHMATLNNKTGEYVFEMSA